MSGRLISSFLLFVATTIGGQTGGSAQQRRNSWTIFLGSTGPITASTTRQDLVAQYGEANVTDQDIDVGEGETEAGTVLFRDDPKRALSLVWNDPETKTIPKAAILRVSARVVRGSTTVWTTAHGISLGTSLRELERINGRSFTLLGFGWDYEGTVSSWNKGVLENDLEGNGRVILRLGPRAVSQKLLIEVQGDRPFSSANPIMQRIDPGIYEIVWEFQHINK
jgi:hypothetical protein